MANSTKLLIAVLVLLFLLEMDVFTGGVSRVEAINCGARCGYRCSKSSRHKMCIRACNTCCQRCNCVPPGTAGNENVCPCYANMKTHGGRHKCP